MIDAADLVCAGIARQARLIEADELSPPELVEACLEQIGALDGRINAFRVVMAESARVEADAAMHVRRSDRGLLHGVPVAVKDNTDVAGQVTAQGTGAYGPPAERDADVVRRLRLAGAIIIGKTTEPELDMWPLTDSATWGITRNPWDQSRTSGGSSGGSAAAVGAGMVGAALGSDGGGSIRIPSACCGVFGIKPQRDRISLAPETGHWHGLTALGPIARTVADAALFLDVVAGSAPVGGFLAATRRPPERLRIAISTRMPAGVSAARAGLHPECQAAFDDAAEILRRLGHQVAHRDPDYGFIAADLLPRYLRGVRDDSERLPHPERLERRSRTIVRAGSLVPSWAVRRSLKRAKRLRTRLAPLFSEHDVLMTPALAAPPLPVTVSHPRSALLTALLSSPLAAYTTPWNITGQPAAVVPVGFTADGLPLAVQLVGRPGDEATLLSLAAQMEQQLAGGARPTPS